MAHGQAVVALIGKVLILLLLPMLLLHLLRLLAPASLIGTSHVLRCTLVMRGLIPVSVTLRASVISLLLSLFHLAEKRVSLASYEIYYLRSAHRFLIWFQPSY